MSASIARRGREIFLISKLASSTRKTFVSYNNFRTYARYMRRQLKQVLTHNEAEALHSGDKSVLKKQPSQINSVLETEFAWQQSTQSSKSAPSKAMTQSNNFAHSTPTLGQKQDSSKRIISKPLRNKFDTFPSDSDRNTKHTKADGNLVKGTKESVTSQLKWKPPVYEKLQDGDKRFR